MCEMFSGDGFGACRCGPLGHIRASHRVLAAPVLAVVALEDAHSLQSVEGHARCGLARGGGGDDACGCTLAVLKEEGEGDGVFSAQPSGVQDPWSVEEPSANRAVRTARPLADGHTEDGFDLLAGRAKCDAIHKGLAQSALMKGVRVAKDLNLVDNVMHTGECQPLGPKVVDHVC